MENFIKDIVTETLGKEGVLADWATFEAVGLPSRKSEEYKFTPISKAIEKSIDLNQIKDLDVPENLPGRPLLSEAHTITFYNGKLISSDFKSEHAISLNDVNDKGLELNEEDWNDPFHLLNKSVQVDGIYLKVQKGATIEKPIYIRYIVDKTNSQAVSFSRMYLHLEENSEVKVIEHYEYEGTNSSFDSVETHFLLEKSARIKTYNLQLEGSEQVHVGNTFVYQQRDSIFNNVSIAMKGKMLRNNIQVWQNDEHCESFLYGLYMLTGSDHVDNHTTVDHRHPNSYSNELYKGILDENSTGVFNGKIYVRPNAQQTNAFQSNNNLLLSDNATLHTKPQLEIWADDVKCSHGCTSGQIDKEAMFYLRTRGLDKTQARAIMLKAFVSEVLDQINIEEIKSEVEHQVDSLLFRG